MLKKKKCTFYQALYNALFYSSDNSALDCDSLHGSSHFSKNACTYNPMGGADPRLPTEELVDGNFSVKTLRKQLILDPSDQHYAGAGVIIFHTNCSNVVFTGGDAVN